MPIPTMRRYKACSGRRVTRAIGASGPRRRVRRRSDRSDRLKRRPLSSGAFNHRALYVWRMDKRCPAGGRCGPSTFQTAARRAAWLSREEAIMGTSVRVELWSDDCVSGEAAITAVMGRMHEIDEGDEPVQAGIGADTHQSRGRQCSGADQPADVRHHRPLDRVLEAFRGRVRHHVRQRGPFVRLPLRIHPAKTTWRGRGAAIATAT